MLYPIHTIDLLYYRKMFAHLNERANQNKEEDDKLSRNFVMSFVERAFAFVEEVYNSNNSFHLDGLQQTMDEVSFAGNLVQYVEDEVSKLREKALKAGWDPRIKIKVSERRIASAEQILLYTMDLEATAEAMAEEPVEEIYDSAFTEKEVIDNPTADQINVWFDLQQTKKAAEDA